MLNFSKNNIVVPKNATKATKTTLSQNRRFWHLWVKIQKTSYLRNDCELTLIFFSGKIHVVSKPTGNIFRSILAGFGHFEVNFWPYPQIKISKNRFFFFDFRKMLHICDKISNSGAKWLKNTSGIHSRPYIMLPATIGQYTKKSCFLV